MVLICARYASADGDTAPRRATPAPIGACRGRVRDAAQVDEDQAGDATGGLRGGRHRNRGSHGVADQREGLSPEAIRHLEDVRRMVDPSVRAWRAHLAQATSAQIDADELDAGIQALREELEPHEVRRQPGNGEHQGRVRRPVASGVEAT